MNGVDDLPSSVRDALAQTPDDAGERASRLEAIYSDAARTANDAVATWAAIERARVASYDGMYELAHGWCERALALNAAPEARASAIVLRELTTAEPEVDRASLEHAAEVLAASGRWEDAMAAHACMADDSAAHDDLAGARREYARAIGCAEAGGARRLGPGYLLKLARVETRLGDPRRAIGQLDHALERLAPVKLLFARYVEADCHDALGDAWAAIGDTARAMEAWSEAAARYERQERARQAAVVRNKAAALHS